MLFTFERCYLEKWCIFLEDRSTAIHHFRLQREQECVISAYPPNYDCPKETNQYVIGTAPSFCITFQQKFISTKVEQCIRISYATALQDSKPNGAFHNCHINVTDIWNYKYDGGTADVQHLHIISL